MTLPASTPRLPSDARSPDAAPTDALRGDPARLAALRASGLLDSEAEEAFDRLTRLAAKLVRVPAAFISMVDEFRDFYKSCVGFGEPLATVRELEGTTFCHYAIREETALVIPDTLADPIYRTVPTVETLGVRAYLGVPIRDRAEQVLGSFCAIDFQPRHWTSVEIEVMVELAASAEREIRLRQESRTREKHAAALLETNEELEQTVVRLRESEARYRSVVEAAPVLTWSNDRDGTTAFFNPRWTEYSGVSGSDAVGLNWFAAIHPEDRTRIAAARERGIATDEPYGLEVRIRRWDGEYRWHRAQVVPLRDEKGKSLAWYGAAVDVDEVKQAQRAAELANRAKSQFLAAMSHELRTPLNAIVGYVDLLDLGVQGSLTEGQRGYLARIRQADSHLLRLIEDVLEYAKLEAGRTLFEIEEVDVERELGAADALIRAHVEAKGHAFPVRCPEPVRALADPTKLRQILLNLLSNAVKFTPAGGRVEMECVAEEGLAVVRVTDSGVGMEPETLDRVFEPFVQGSDGLTRAEGGAGLGLAISRDLAQGMGGSLVARSTPGEGSAFTLTLPLAR